MCDVVWWTDQAVPAWPVLTEGLAWAVAGVVVSITGAGMTAPGALRESWALLGRAWRQDVLTPMQRGWLGRLWRWVLRKPEPERRVVGAISSTLPVMVQMGSGSVARPWPGPVSAHERTEWLHREVVRLQASVRTVRHDVTSESTTREAAVQDLTAGGIGARTPT